MRPLILCSALLVGCVRAGFDEPRDGAGPPGDGAPSVDATQPADGAPPGDNLPRDLAAEQDQQIGPQDLAAEQDQAIGPDSAPLPGTWVNDPLPASSSGAMHDVWVDATRVFVVGDAGKVIMDSGNGWTQIQGLSTTLRSVWGFAGGSAAVAGDGSELHLYAKFWAQIPVPGALITLEGVWGTSGSDLWVVGGTTIWHRDSTGILMPVSGCSGISYYAVHGTSPGNVWFAGKGGVCHHDGSKLTKLPLSATLRALWIAPATGNVWLAGDGGVIATVTSSGLSAYTQTVSAAMLNGIWGSSEKDIWAVGTGGTILHYNGASWTQVASPTTNHLSAVWGSSATRVYAVGAKGTAIKLQP